MRINSALGLLMICSLVAGCESANAVVGSGTLKSEKRDVPAFNGVRSDGGFTIDITVGEATDVEVQADDNILPLIHTSVKDGSLVIKSHESYRSNHSVKVTIKTPQLDAVADNGSSDVTARGVKSDSFKIAINGSGSMRATGSAKEIDAAINGSGDLKLTDLPAADAKIAIAGSGSAAVDVSDTLHVAISGSGDVTYKPRPGLKISNNIIGSGSVKSM